jgi:very-short-patch-repair endonuclease
MRNNPTRAEAMMWDILRRDVYQNFPNHIFYRQSVKYGYILDFYCPTLRLGIEVNGSMHNEQQDYDCQRDNALARHGIQIFRFSNDNVLHNPTVVASDLHQILEEKNSRRGFIATPEQGQTTGATLQKRSGCFIATAAYGTPMAQEIDNLRRFRDLRLEGGMIGRHLVTLYYDTSPPLASVIARSKNMKAFVRFSLKPIIRFFESRSK